MSRADGQSPNARWHAPSFGTEAVVAFRVLIDARGRRDVLIFGLPHDQILIAATLIICVGIPLALFIAALPFWDHVGTWTLVDRVNSYIAPAVGALQDQYRPKAAPRFPEKRFLIASTSMVEIVLLSNFVALFFRRVRRHTLLVWIYFDRQRIF